jgi:hypothetical protein
VLVVGSDIRAILQNVANLTRVFPAFYQNLTRRLSASGDVVCAQLGQIFGQIMTSLELLLALADEETLELARRMIGKPRLALLLAKAAIGTEGGAGLDAGEVAEILGVHKRHAYRLKKGKPCQMEKRVTDESQNDHKRFAGESQNGAAGRMVKKHV